MNSDPPSLAPGRLVAEQPSTSHEGMDRNWLIGIIERYEAPLIAYACRLLHGDGHRARDCVQETFMRLCREDQTQVQNHVEAWLFKCCRHRAMDLFRKESSMFVQLTSNPVEQTVSLESNNPADRAIIDEELQWLQKQIANLSLRDQEVLSLRLQQGLSYKQIAEVMDLSVSHVGVVIHQAVNRLRESLPSIQNSH